MLGRVLVTAGALLVLCMSAAAQVVPHITGRVDVGLASGVVRAELCLSNLPSNARRSLLLFRGMNIKRIRSRDRSLRYRGYEDGEMVGEANVYALRDSLLPGEPVCVDYVGAFPVYHVADGDYNVLDYKGVIAFNGVTARAAEQMMWYPVPYEAAAGARAHLSMTYDITLRCEDCRSLYLNGDDPKPGPEARFASTNPVELLFFVGNYDWRRLGDGLTVINGSEPASVTAAVSRAVDSLQAFLEGTLGVPYGRPMVFIQHTILENNPRRRWGFVTYPTVAFSGDGLAGFVDSLGRVADFAWGYLGHEMSHYYFGTVLRPAGPYRWFLGESTAEYLGMMAMRRFAGTDAFLERVAERARNALSDTALLRFDHVTSPNQVTNMYRYEYGPLLLVSLADEVGEPSVARFLAELLRGARPPESYQDLRAAARRAGIGEEAWERWSRACIAPPAATSCVRRYTK